MIETARLILRPWNEKDADSLFKYASDPDVGPIAGWAPHTSVAESLEIIRTVFAAPEVYAVVLKETGEAVGCCGLIFGDNVNDARHREAELGYWIGKPYWGRGLMSEAVLAILKRGFEVLGLDVIWCSHYDGNIRSKRVIEKAGFIFDHTNSSSLSPLGDTRSVHYYRMTSADFGLAELH